MFRIDWVVWCGAVVLLLLSLFRFLTTKKSLGFVRCLPRTVIYRATFILLWYYVCGKTALVGGADLIWFVIGLAAGIAVDFVYTFPQLTPGVRVREPEALVAEVKSLDPTARTRLARYTTAAVRGRYYMFRVLLPLSCVGVLYFGPQLVSGIPSTYITAGFLLWLAAFFSAGLTGEQLIIACTREGEVFREIGVRARPVDVRRWKEWPWYWKLLCGHRTTVFLIVVGFASLVLLPSFSADESVWYLIDWSGPISALAFLSILGLGQIERLTGSDLISRERDGEKWGHDAIFLLFSSSMPVLVLTALKLLISPVSTWAMLGVMMFMVSAYAALINRPTRGWVWLVSFAIIVLIAIEGIPRLDSKRLLSEAEGYMMSGDFAVATERLRGSMESVKKYQNTWRALYLPESFDVVSSIRIVQVQMALAKGAIATGEYSKAMEHLQELETGHGFYASKRIRIQTALLSAEMYYALGDRAKEEEMIKKAWDLANKTFNRPYWTAHVNRYRARLKMERGNYNEAIKILKDMEQVGKRIGSYRLLISGIGGMGDVYAKQGRYQDAERSYSESLRLSQKYMAKGDEVQYLLRLAMAQKQTGNMQTSSTNLSQAITIAREISSHETLWQGYYQMGLLLEGQGKKEEAFKNYADAINVIETIRGSLKKEEQRLGYAAGKMPVYERMALLLFQQSKKNEAFSFIQKGKSRAFLDLLGTRMVAFRDEDRKLAEKENTLQIKINALLELVSEEESKPDRLQSGKLKEWKEVLQKALTEHKDVLAEINRTNPRLASLTTVPTVHISDVQQVLRQDEVFLEYFVTEDKLLFSAISKTETMFFEIPLTKKALHDIATQVYEPISANRMPGITTLNKAYAALLEPAMGHFGNKNHLIIAPHEKLCLIPFEALVVNPGSQSFVVDRHTVSYYPSASVLVLNRKHNVTRPSVSKPLFAVGDAVFSQDDQRYRPQVAMADGERGVLERRVMMDNAMPSVSEKTKVKITLQRLPATGAEVRAISALMGISGESKDIKMGIHATEKEVKNTDHTQYRYEHYATHGVLRGDIPGLKEPALVFSLPNPDDPQADEGFLTMSEIFGLRTHADAIVLSACNTAIGEEVPGEGLIGLTRAFMYAGTPSVVASLWSVNDESTAKLMVSFYSYLRQGKDKAEALSLAKRELKRAGYFNPYYWAPFILVGER